MKRKYDLKIPCSHEGCNEIGWYSYDTKKEYVEGYKRHKTWTCIRHSRPNEVLTPLNTETEKIFVVKELLYNDGPEILGKFWQPIENIGTDKVDSGFIYGSGYRAFASNFPEGTILKVVAKIIIPKIIN